MPDLPPVAVAPGDLRKLLCTGPRPGMMHPPQNPKVQKELLAYLHASNVKPRRASPPEPPKVTPQPPPPAGPATGSQPARCNTAPPARPRVARSPGSSGRQHGSGRMGRTSSSASGGFSVRRDSDSPQPQLSEDQLNRRLREFRYTSRSCGVEMGARSTEDLVELTQFHNQVVRRKLPPKFRTAGSAGMHVEQLRDLRFWLAAPRQSMWREEPPEAAAAAARPPRMRAGLDGSSPLLRFTSS